jgi:hypothetical protein
MAPTAPRTPAEHHYDVAESGLADLGRVGFDDRPHRGSAGRAHTRHARYRRETRHEPDGVLP